MTINPADMMRSYIIDMETYGLAEQAGKFCEALRESMGEDLSLFYDTKFIYSAEEPYEAVFIWDLGDLRAKLTFMGDPDNSTWAVSSRKKRFRGAIGKDPNAACRLFLDSLRDTRFVASHD